MPESAPSPKKESRTAVQAKPPAARTKRAWYTDALLSFACFVVLIALGRGVARMFGIFAGLFFLAVVGGAGYQLGKSAWRGLMGERGSHD